VTTAEVRKWHADMGTSAPTARAHAYSLLRTIYRTAEREGAVSASPCRIDGAGSTKRVRRIDPAGPAQVYALAEAMP